MTTEEIINNINNVKFYETGYLQYYGLIDNYLIELSPYVIEISEIIKYIPNITKKIYYTNNGLINKKRFHHLNYTRHDCTFDPCILFETITGLKPGVNPLFNHNSAEEYEDYINNNKLVFDKIFQNQHRKTKLNKLNKYHSIM